MEVLYHGSTVLGLTELQPFRRTTPGELKKEDVPESIYATDNPLAAVMFSFPWRSEEGIDLQIVGETLKLIVPSCHKDRLTQPIALYQLSRAPFTRVPNVSQAIGNFWAQESVPVSGVEEFPNVYSGVARFGGEIAVI
jgi:hypothetical protein